MTSLYRYKSHLPKPFEKKKGGVSYLEKNDIMFPLRAIIGKEINDYYHEFYLFKANCKIRIKRKILFYILEKIE